jgi:hypothetical protein
MIQQVNPLRLFYVDDSGSVDTGYVVYSWIETTSQGWRHALRAWLNLRKDLYAKYQIPPSHELHATKFVPGRQNPSLDPAFNRSKQARSDVMKRALTAIGSTGHMGVGTVFRRTRATGSAYHLERASLYAAFVRHLDTRLATDDELGLVFMDGDDHDSVYRDAHRDLDLSTRRVVEDPLFQGSHRSQPVQMADLVAWTAYQSLLQHPGKQYAWSWYDKFLRGADVNGYPLEL